MRAVRNTSAAYQFRPAVDSLGVWPQAGFSGIAYRLAKLSAPRFGVLAALSAVFYFF